MLKKVLRKFRQRAGEEAAFSNRPTARPQPPAAPSCHVEWVVAFCLAFASQPIQTTTSSSKVYVEVGLALIMCSFAALFISKCPCFGFRTCRVMQQAGLFLGVTAFFMRTTCQTSVWLKCTGWTVYALTWLAIVFFNTNIVNSPSQASPAPLSYV